MESLNRTELLIGADGIEKLQNAHVAVCGLGAVGSYAAEALVRAGVGSLRIVDYDVVDESNINRQLYALASTVGKKKTYIAEKRILDINPDCSVDVLASYINEETNPAVMAAPVDVLIDAIDSLAAKVYLIADAHRAGIHVISSMGAAGRMDANLITSGDLSETHTCPLARCVRRRLHRQEIFTGVRCIYSTEIPKKQNTEIPRPHDDNRPPVLGSISYLTGIFGLKAAYEAINYILLDKVIGR